MSCSILLRIPLELREEIIQYVLYSLRPSPDGPSYPHNRVRLFDVGFDSLLSLLSHRLRHEKPVEWTIPAGQALLLVNRQIAAETRAILARYPLTYQLDIMMIQERYLWPTWLSVPVLSNRIDELKITFRTFGSAVSPRNHQHMFSSSPTGMFDYRLYTNDPPRLVLCLLSVIERILLRGVPFPSPARLSNTSQEWDVNTIESLLIVEDDILPEEDSEELRECIQARTTLAQRIRDREVIIGTLVLDIQSPTAWHGQTTPEPEVGFAEWKSYSYHFAYQAFSPFAFVDSSESSLVTDIPVARSGWLASMISSEITALLRMKYQSIFCNDLIFERIGRIQVKVDGVLFAELNLDEMLANLQFTGGWLPRDTVIDSVIDSVDKRRWQFFGWKERTKRFRMKRGLPVVHVGDSLELFESRLL
ncbi:hypothetical protein BDBG_07441 [Blastomyces gilchristii SLH14081]|uniref:F-box domain-containing protein n=1 Tax=Blastomyces gilchristii (strain SLH14081) TaxID=559298 RepID=A0A179UVG9_BLAGS|nr:uncharacterized protein BDBG_07441 [Blastomyces gilchristii SLH14081]OAT12044.1 hypothetical protein BDBG_07441 [Blastomyces gilchristii SLH14081]